jgi:hypothetical protein
MLLGKRADGSGCSDVGEFGYRRKDVNQFLLYRLEVNLVVRQSIRSVGGE